MFHFFIWKFPSLVNAGNWIWLTSWFSCTIYYLQSNWHYWSIIKEACIVKETIDWKVHSAILMSWMSLGLSFKLTQGNKNKNWWEQNWQSSQSLHLMCFFLLYQHFRRNRWLIAYGAIRQRKTQKKYWGWHIRSVQQLKEIFRFSEEYAAREDAGVEQMMHILCTHQRFRSKTRSCREILEGNGEKYYKEMQRNI